MKQDRNSCCYTGKFSTDVWCESRFALRGAQLAVATYVRVNFDETQVFGPRSNFDARDDNDNSWKNVDWLTFCFIPPGHIPFFLSIFSKLVAKFLNTGQVSSLSISSISKGGKISNWLKVCLKLTKIGAPAPQIGVQNCMRCLYPAPVQQKNKAKSMLVWPVHLQRSDTCRTRRWQIRTRFQCHILDCPLCDITLVKLCKSVKSVLWNLDNSGIY